MGEETKPAQKKDTGGEIHIDYDNVDVAEIMNQIRGRIESASRERPSESAPPLESVAVHDSQEAEPEEIIPPPSGFKRLIARLFKPFSPLIKFLVFPVHREVQETSRVLHHTNLRLDKLGQDVEKRFDDLGKSLHQLALRLDAVEEKIDRLTDTHGRTKEYVKLLHHLTHNLVVELTKLKIEGEDIKLKARVLAKDFEFLERKEKALEKKVYK